jgi:hypothetical protein
MLLEVPLFTVPSVQAGCSRSAVRDSMLPQRAPKMRAVCPMKVGVSQRWPSASSVLTISASPDASASCSTVAERKLMTESFGLPEMTKAVLKRLLRQFTQSSIWHQPCWRQELQLHSMP